jgi:hypothetical protein
MGKNDSSKDSEPASPAPTAAPEVDGRTPTRRHPLFGVLKGLLRVMPGTDLTKPACPDWGRGTSSDENVGQRRVLRRFSFVTKWPFLKTPLNNR